MTIECPICKKIFEDCVSNHRIYCSNKCWGIRRRKTNSYRTEGDITYILLANTKIETKIDTSFYEKARPFRWGIDTGGYARAWNREKQNKFISLHWLVMKDEPSFAGAEIDHINGDKIDNRRTNLQYLSHKENMRKAKLRRENTSGCKGVSFCKKKKLWLAVIGSGVSGKKLGKFKNKSDAIKARIEGEKLYWGKTYPVIK